MDTRSNDGGARNDVARGSAAENGAAFDANALVKLIYRSALEPLAFTDFIDALHETDPAASDPNLLTALVEHLDIAAELAVSKDKADAPTSMCAVTFDKQLVVSHCDADAAHEFGALFSVLKEGCTLEFADEAFTTMLEDGMRVLTSTHVAKYPIVYEHEARLCCCYLVLVGDGAYVLSLLRNGFLEDFDLSTSFLKDLTRAEHEVCLALFEGRTPAEIADRTNVASSTVKSHLKAVFDKLGVNRQIDLVRLLDQAFLLERHLESALAVQRPFIQANGANSPNLAGRPKKSAISKSGNRRIGFREYGSEDGRPVVYLHGFLGCGILSPKEAEAARRSTLRIIAIDRPGYGSTDKVGNAAIDIVTGDCLAVLDQLEIESVEILAFARGALFALALAAREPKRITAVYLCSTSFGANDLAEQPHFRGQFADLLLSRFPTAAAAVAKLFLRPRSATQFKHQAEKIWSESPPDLAALQDPALLTHLRATVNEAIGSGIDGPIFDLRALRAANINLADVRQPVTAWHGECDISLAVAAARTLLSPLPDLRFITVRQRGQLMFHTDFAAIAETIAAGK